MAKLQNSFEDFYFETTKETLPLSVLENYAKNHAGDYEYYEKRIFCPECNLPQLTLVQGKSYHLRTYPKQSHHENCSYYHEYALNKIAQNYYESLEPDQIKNKLFEAMTWLKKQSRTKNNLSGLGNTVYNLESNLFLFSIPKSKGTKIHYALRRKNLNNGLSDDMLGDLHIFYGKVKLESKSRVAANGTSYYYLIIKSKSSNGVWKKLVEVFRNLKEDNVDLTKEYDLVLIGKLGSEYKSKDNELRINKGQIALIDQSALAYSLHSE